MSIMSGWMNSQEKNLKDLSFESSGKYWTGTELIAELEVAGIDGNLIKMNQVNGSAMTREDVELVAPPDLYL